MRTERMGPPSIAAIAHIRKRLELACVECECCGQPWHFKCANTGPYPMSFRAGGRLMSARRATYMAFHPDKKLHPGRRITSRCDNPRCINPALLVQVLPGAVLSRHYELGLRSKAAAAALLIKHVRSKSKLTDADVVAIRNDDRKGAEAAHEWGISATYYNAVQRGAARQAKSSNHFAGLGAR